MEFILALKQGFSLKPSKFPDVIRRVFYEGIAKGMKAVEKHPPINGSYSPGPGEFGLTCSDSFPVTNNVTASRTF